MSWSRCSGRVSVHVKAGPGHAVLAPTIRHRLSALSHALLPLASCSPQAQASSGKHRPSCLVSNRQHKHALCLGSRWSSSIHSSPVTRGTVRGVRTYGVRAQARSCFHARGYFTQAKDWTIKPFTFMDTFAGIGGNHVAASKLGGICTYANEKNRYCIDTYEKNHCRGGPGISNVDGRDIRAVTLTMSHSSSMLPEADMLFAGIPCQPFSNNGNREGLDDKENGGLIYALMKLPIQLRIPVVILENVSGFATDKEIQGINVAQQEFEAAGYYMSWHIYRAVDFNLAQNRLRCFIVAVRSDLATGPFEFKNPPSRRQKPALTDFLDPPEAIKDLDQYTLSRNGVLVPKLFIKEKQAEIEWVEEIKASKSGLKKLGKWKYEGQKGDGYNAGRTVYHHSGLASCITTEEGDWYQVPGPDGRDVIIRLSLPVMLRLQGFPEGFELPVSRNQAIKQIGNAVPPPMVEWIIRCVQDQFSHISTSGIRSNVEVWPHVQARNRSPEEKESIRRQLNNLSQHKIRGKKRRDARKPSKEDNEALDTSNSEGVKTRHATGPGKSIAAGTEKLNELDKQVKALQKDIASLKIEYKRLAKA